MKKKKWLMVVSLLIAVVIAISLVTFTGKSPIIFKPLEAYFHIKSEKMI